MFFDTCYALQDGVDMSVTIPFNVSNIPQCVCDKRECFEEAFKILAGKFIFMSTMTFLVVCYMAITYKLKKDWFDKTVQECIFILIITSVWMLEVVIRGI